MIPSVAGAACFLSPALDRRPVPAPPLAEEGVEAVVRDLEELPLGDPVGFVQARGDLGRSHVL